MNLLALHGFTGCGGDFSKFSPFCGPGVTWHCPDLPGHGPEPDMACAPEAMIEFVEQQRRALPPSQPNQPQILLGYSMGARAALMHAIHYPDHWDALILISGNPGIRNGNERAERHQADIALAEKIEQIGVEHFLQHWQQQPIIRSQSAIRSEWRESMWTDRLSHTAEGLAASLRQFSVGNCPDLWPEFSRITKPILLITGKQDKKYERIAREIAKRIPARHVSIPNTGHMPHLEAPAPTAAAITDFLQGIR